MIQFEISWRLVETMFQLQLLLLVILLITVLMSHNVIHLEYFMPMSHGVNKKAPTIVSPNPSPKQVSSRLVILQVIIYQPSFALI